jgi:DNA recombination protein RmuC
MDLTSLVVGVLAGLVIGAALGWLMARIRDTRQLAEETARPAAESAAATARLDELGKRLAALETEIKARDQALAESRRDTMGLQQQLAKATADLEAERRAAADRRALVDQADARIREVLGALSAEALQKNSQAFLDLARAALVDLQKHASSDLDHRQKSIGELLTPLRDALGRVDAKLHEVETGRVSSESRLGEQLRTLALTTTNLERALRTPDVRGGWGEIQLRRVVEMAGMLEHCHFVEKPAASTDDGRLIPDLIIKLPGGRNIVVDAKVPYVAYREAVEASDDTTKASKLGDHARQVRDHMAALSGKAYWSQFQPAPEFVFMFLPGEGYLSAALQHDPALIEFGVAKRVIPASPLTLIALLRAVAYGWQQERIAENALAISQMGRQLYERISHLAEHFEEMGKGLVRAVDAYNRTVGTLESRVLVTARRLKDLGVTAAEPIAELSPVDRMPRALQAPEMADLFGGHREIVDGETVATDEEE